MGLRRFAVPWFCEEDWLRWREIDPQFEPDYATWLAGAVAHLEGMKDQGRQPEKVIIDPEVFLAWSAALAGALMARLAPPLLLSLCTRAKAARIEPRLPGDRDQPVSGAATNDAD